MENEYRILSYNTLCFCFWRYYNKIIILKVFLDMLKNSVCPFIIS